MVFAMTLNTLLFTLSYLLYRSSTTTAELGFIQFKVTQEYPLQFYNIRLLT